MCLDGTRVKFLISRGSRTVFAQYFFEFGLSDSNQFLPKEVTDCQFEGRACEVDGRVSVLFSASQDERFDDLDCGLETAVLLQYLRLLGQLAGLLVGYIRGG